MRKIEITLPDPEETEKTGIDTADEFTLGGPMIEEFIKTCEMRGLDPEKEINSIFRKALDHLEHLN